LFKADCSAQTFTEFIIILCLFAENSLSSRQNFYAMRFIFSFLLVTSLFGCTSLESPQEKEVAVSELPLYKISKEKESFLDKVDLLRYPDEIQLDLAAFDISLPDLQAYCIKKDSAEREAGLITAMASGFYNHLSEGNSDYWGGILYDMESYVSIVKRLKSEHHQTFMDIGSGNGEKIYAALCLGFQKGFGLEYAPELVEISKNFLAPYTADSTIKIQLGDALQIEGGYYAQADFLYMYSPIKSHETMAVLYERVMKNMKNGAILLEVRFVYAKEIKERTKLNFPAFSGVFAIEKINNQFYYLQFDQTGIYGRILLKPIENQQTTN